MLLWHAQATVAAATEGAIADANEERKKRRSRLTPISKRENLPLWREPWEEDMSTYALRLYIVTLAGIMACGPGERNRVLEDEHIGQVAQAIINTNVNGYNFPAVGDARHRSWLEQHAYSPKFGMCSKSCSYSGPYLCAVINDRRGRRAPRPTTTWRPAQESALLGACLPLTTSGGSNTSAPLQYQRRMLARRSAGRVPFAFQEFDAAA